jgi:hypothetical protein
MAKIAILHHLSSSGGTIFSKCLAAQPHTVLLSEVHPLTGMIVPLFMPIDPLAHFLSGYPELSPSEDELEALFLARLAPVVSACERHGKILILRDHSHSDYLMDREPRPRLAELLAKHYEVKRAVTFRNPIDAYLSMKQSQFDSHLHGFDDYCRRAVVFLKDHSHVPMWTYEKFVDAPAETIQDICDSLGIAYDPSFIDRINDKVLTGDSGRRPANITKLSRRYLTPELRAEIATSTAFGDIAKFVGYDARGVNRHDLVASRSGWTKMHRLATRLRFSLIDKA